MLTCEETDRLWRLLFCSLVRRIRLDVSVTRDDAFWIRESIKEQEEEECHIELAFDHRDGNLGLICFQHSLENRPLPLPKCDEAAETIMKKLRSLVS